GLADYEARVEDLRTRLRDVTVSHVQLVGNETFDNYLEGPGAFGPFRVLEELGVERPPAEVTGEDTFSRTLSLEELPELTGDVLFYNVGYTGLDDASQKASEQVVDSPLWQKVPAVQDGEAYRVGPDHWAQFGGLRSANLVLDDVEKHLT
ncbi:MAG: iron-siderophore ABC transporter substrate-binding protein, partial [Rubrobacter sp.]